MRHLVGGDTYYLVHVTGDPAREIDSDGMGHGELRAEMEADDRTWIELLARELDPDAVVRDVDEDGYERWSEPPSSSGNRSRRINSPDAA